jgi:hypothetical protein
VDIFWCRSTFDTGRRSRTSRTLEFASFNKPTVAALFHVNSSLAAVHNWRRPRLSTTEPVTHCTNSLEVSNPYHGGVSEFDPQEMIMRFRERAEAVRRRGLPPVEGPDRQRILQAATVDFQDFAMLGDASASLEDGILRLEIDLRPRPSVTPD